MKRYKKSLIWAALGMGAVLLRLALSGSPELIERYYSRGLFLGIRALIDYCLAWLPFPLLYLVVLALLIGLPLRIRGWWRATYLEGAWGKAMSALIGLLGFAGGTAFLFLLLWGYNYGRVPIDQQLGLKMKPLALEELKAELMSEAEALKGLRQQIEGADSSAIHAELLPADLEHQVRASLEQWLTLQDFPAFGRVRGKLIYPKGIFLRFGSSGLYFPWTGEGHIDAGLHPLQQISVMAHELGHGYGFGDEGTCNFLAYVACSTAQDPLIAYAGRLGYWRTLAANYLRQEPKAYRDFRDTLPLGMQADLDAINEAQLRYPDLMPALRYRAYDTYLKSQGVQEGMKSYSQVIMMVKAWKEQRRG